VNHKGLNLEVGEVRGSGNKVSRHSRRRKEQWE
jgi:hypothetical protein